MIVKAVVLDRLVIVGYVVEDDDGNELRLNSKTFLELVKDGKFKGVDITEVDGKSYLTGLKIRDLLIDSPLKVVIKGKEYDNNKVIGYKVVKEGEEAEKSISSQKAWDLAATGCISNAQAMFINESNDVKKYLKCDL